jgi:stage III sporulation protein AH
MSKAKNFAKRMVVMASLIAVLSAAMFLNWKYGVTDGSMDVSGMLSGTQYLGDAQYVNEAVTNEPKTTEESDYFSDAKKNRDDARAKTLASLKEVAEDIKASDEAKEAAGEKINQIADKAELEASIETLVCSKGFSDCVVVLTDKQVNVIVKAPKKGLLESETMQIQDIVTSNSEILLENIKIIEVK